jgi:hypothetical protein
MDTLVIKNRIHEIRGFKVMLDFDLAELYQVETKVLNQSVKRHLNRFPEDFMFQLTNVELTDLYFKTEILRSQIVTSRWGGKRYLPYAFTEQGVAMLSGLLRSEKAIEVNIEIMRAFVMMRHYVLNYAELNQKLEDFMRETGAQFSDVYQVLDELSAAKKELDKPRNPVGFKLSNG